MRGSLYDESRRCELYLDSTTSTKINVSTCLLTGENSMTFGLLDMLHQCKKNASGRLKTFSILPVYLFCFMQQMQQY